MRKIKFIILLMFSVVSIYGQNREITGNVTDENQEPMIGVTIVVKGTTIGTVTSNDGNYALTIPTNARTLVFSFVGYATEEVEIGTSSVLNVSMNPSAIGIEEVVAIGYGTQKKENLTGAVSQVTSEAIENRPIRNLGEGLQGLIPNLNIIVPDGNPSSTPSFNVRGYTSITGGSPLILVDGVNMDVNLINIEDIESISVLKDASSAAVFGARASYGVILITTKSGKTGVPKINISSSFQLTKPTNLPTFVESYPLALETNASWMMRYGSPLFTDKQVGWIKEYYENPENTSVYHIEDNGNIFWNGNFNPWDYLLSDWYPAQKHTLSFSGGTENMTYYASAGYQAQDGIWDVNTDKFKQYNILVKLENRFTKWLKMGLQTSYNISNYNEPYPYVVPNVFSAISKNWRNMRVGAPPVTPDYSPIGEGVPIDETGYGYLVGGRQITTKDESFIKINSEIQLLEGLKLNSDFAYRGSNIFRKGEKIPVDMVLFNFNSIINGWTAPGFVERNNNKINYFVFNAYANYEKVINNHSFNALIGFNQEWSTYESLYGRGMDLITPNLPSISLTTGDQYANDSEGHWAIRGSFFRLFYNYKNKYLIELNGRYDGTSKFPEESRFALFPSISAGWRISEENFFNPLKNTLTYAKIRASYGSLGNQEVANYFYIPFMSVTPQVNYIINGRRPLGVNNPGLVSSDLTWETTTTLNFGTDLLLWEKASLSFDWFRRSTSDMLTSAQALPSVLGTGVPRENNADMETTGWELSLGWRNQYIKEFRYNIDFVLSDYQAKITRFDGNPNKLITNYYEGQKMGEIWGYETAGLFQSQEEVLNSPSQNKLGNAGKWAPGEVRYADLNKDGIIDWGNNTVDNPGDQKIIGNSTPRFSFGLNSTLEYKGFDMFVFFQGIGKKDIVPVNELYWGLIGQRFAMMRQELYDNRWSEDNPNAYYPVSNNNSPWNRLPQTRYLQSGAYIRLKNLSLGYSLPYEVINKIDISKLRIYFSVNNLWEYSSLPEGFDPETHINQTQFSGLVYPFPRTFSLGINLTL